MLRVKFVPVLFVVWTLVACDGPQARQPAVETPPAPQKAPDEAAALAAIANVNVAQKDFFTRNRRYALTYEELMGMFFLKEEPTIQTTGFEIRLRPAADAASYVILATPSMPSPGTRHFFSNQTGTIRAEQGKNANAESPMVVQ
jgi:hypothetical protein